MLKKIIQSLSLKFMSKLSHQMLIYVFFISGTWLHDLNNRLPIIVVSYIWTLEKLVSPFLKSGNRFLELNNRLKGRSLWLFCKRYICGTRLHLLRNWLHMVKIYLIMNHCHSKLIQYKCYKLYACIHKCFLGYF